VDGNAEDLVMITSVQIAWLAGILEGEGSFKLNDNSANIQLNMTDEDTVKKVARLFNRQYSENRSPERVGHKRLYYVNIMGTPAIEWMMTIYSLMSYRRQEKIREIITSWKEINTVKRDVFKCGHPKIASNFRYNGKYKICLICATARSSRWYLRSKAADSNV